MAEKLDLSDYEAKARAAVRLFWSTRTKAGQKQKAAGKSDQGTRGDVTAGKHMDGFRDLFVDVIRANGLSDKHVFQHGAKLNIPGHFRAIKNWDLLVIRHDRLIAAVEFKSMVGSFGNNLNNRSEEVLGLGLDLWRAFQEGMFGENGTQPFVGYFFLLEDLPESRSPVSINSKHFDVLPEFIGKSYAERLDILCRKMVQEQLYTAACTVFSKKEAVSSGDYSELSDTSGLRNFVTTLADHIAAAATR